MAEDRGNCGTERVPDDPATTPLEAPGATPTPSERLGKTGTRKNGDVRGKKTTLLAEHRHILTRLDEVVT
jgi:hypothetical protein